MKPRSAATYLCGFYFLFYGFYGVIIPYLPVWLASRGLDQRFVGLVIASAFLPKVISAPVFAHFADAYGKHRVLIQMLLFATLMALVSFFYAQTKAWFFSLTMAVNFFAPAILPLMDRAAISQQRRDGASIYTTIRLWGSLGFAVFSMAGGILIDRAGADGVIWLGAALTLACMVLARMSPAMGSPVTAAVHNTPDAGHARSPLMSILRDSPVVWCIVASALVQASNGYLYSYASLYWIALGLETTQIGVLWTVGIASEILLFLLARKVLARISPVRLIMLSGALTAVRWAGLGLTHDVVWMALLQVLQAFTLAGNNMAIMAFLAQRVQERSRTTAIALYTMLSAGLFMFLAINLVNLMGVSQTGAGFGVMAACALLAVPLVWHATRARQ